MLGYVVCPVVLCFSPLCMKSLAKTHVKGDMISSHRTFMLLKYTKPYGTLKAVLRRIKWIGLVSLFF